MAPIDLLLALVCFQLIPLAFGCQALYNYRLIVGARGFAAEIGKVVLDESSVWSGAKLVIEPADSLLRRVELSPCSTDGKKHWRLLVDLTPDCDYRFEMWNKLWGSEGRVFEPGEGMIGIDAVDERFWTDTAVSKEVAALLNDPKLLQVFAGDAVYEPVFVKVTGNRIELRDERGKDEARAMFHFASFLARRMFELG